MEFKDFKLIPPQPVPVTIRLTTPAMAEQLAAIVGDNDNLTGVRRSVAVRLDAAPGVAYVPEQLANPVRVELDANQTITVRFKIERGWEDGAPMIEIYIGDNFFQEQPLGAANAETVAKIGTPICWYNVGLSQHTTTGGFWDSGPLNQTEAYIWVPDRTGVLPYTCRFHGTQMISSLRITA